MTTQVTKGADTRARIIDAGARLFLERGFVETSVSDVISESGLTKGGFYFHFASKAALGLAVVDATRATFQARVIDLAGARARATDQVVAIVRAIAAQKSAMPGMAALGRLCFDLAAEPDIGGRLKPFEAWVEMTRELLDRAQREGDLPATVDLDQAARFTVSSYVGLDHIADLTRTRPDSSVVEAYLGFMFRALGITRPIPSVETLT
ncbi:MAG: TetR/AcrR family transcriptional regulator [Actinobacteria bacterium]|nr:TetR/AcrR family transcriptional regulator [Actinomycetota bacterium]